MMNGSLPRTLKVGRISIGLVGLDIALNRIGRDLSLSSEEAARRRLEDISARNYIPTGATEIYLHIGFFDKDSIKEKLDALIAE